MAGASSYKTSHSSDSLGSLATKLQDDLRSKIRDLGCFPFMSSAWQSMAKALVRIANISEMERKLPKKEGATLWECEEVALRFLLEEGKNNMLLRATQQYVDAVDPEKTAATAAAAKAAVPSVGSTAASSASGAAGAAAPAGKASTDASTGKALSDSFEYGMGRLLSNSFGHIESLHVTSPQLLVQTMASILAQRIRHPSLEVAPTEKLDPKLGACCLEWTLALGKGLGRVDESRVCAEVQKHNLLGLLAGFLCRHHAGLSDRQLLQGVEGIALLADSEDIRAGRMKMIKEDEIGPRILGLEARFLGRLTKEDAEARKACRGVLDLIALGKRKKVVALPEEAEDRKAAAGGAEGAATGGASAGASPGGAGAGAAT